MLYKKMYLLLFNRITDALEALKKSNYSQAEEILRSAQTDAENLYIEGGEP